MRLQEETPSGPSDFEFPSEEPHEITVLRSIVSLSPTDFIGTKPFNSVG